MRKLFASITLSTLLPALLLLTLNALGKENKAKPKTPPANTATATVAVTGKTISKVDITKKNMKELTKELEKLKKENGGYPTNDTWIKSVDGWGNKFHYFSDGKSYHVGSFGADNKEGGEAMDMDLGVGN